MSKTVQIEDNIHNMIIDKRKEIKERYKVELKISDIVNKILENNIQNYDIKE